MGPIMFLKLFLHYDKTYSMYLTQPGYTTFVAHPFAQLWVSGLLFWAILIRTCDDQRMAGTKVQGGLGVIWEIDCF
jgi:hypothetical protein